MPDKYGNPPRLMEHIPVVPQPILPPSVVSTWVAPHMPAKPELSENSDNPPVHSTLSLEYILNYDTVECHLHVVKTPVSTK
jgi:hypothetical protein